MKTRKLRDLEVTEIGMGCMGFSHGYGKVPEERYSIEAIRKARDFGCNFFDTAEVYGMQQFEKGHNERLVGKAIEPFRKDVILATKLHIDTEEPKNDGGLYNTIRRHLEASMEKLRSGERFTACNEYSVLFGELFVTQENQKLLKYNFEFTFRISR